MRNYTFEKTVPKFPISSLFVALFMLTSVLLFGQDGEKLFKANCASCHKVDKKLIGPALQGVSERWENQDNLIAWIQNSQDYLKKNPGDGYAAKMFEEFNKSIMPAQAVSKEEVLAILDYVNNWQPEVAAAPTTADGGTTQTPTNDYTMYWLLAFALVFFVLIRILMDVKKSINNVLAEANGTPKNPEDDMGMFESAIHFLQVNKKITAVIIIVLLGYGAVKGWDAVNSVGVYTNYEPEQPIKFSHKIHAGENGINCVYCHHSAEKSKTSGIPSVNVCMNCHKGIPEGKRYGATEIAKIYEAAGFNPETGRYDQPEKPIKWVRIHNLPDFAYFNHSQHVTVGEIECQTCHGPVEEMDVLYQYSDLTMGWCINCHRETKVKMTGNGYYDQLRPDLLEIHKHDGVEDFTVEHIGGLECAKCHY